MKAEINTVKDLRDFLTKLIRKSKCGDERLRFYFPNEGGIEWLKLKSTCRGGIMNETIIEFE